MKQGRISARRPRLIDKLAITVLLVLFSFSTAQNRGGHLEVAIAEPIPSLDIQRAITPGIVDLLINVVEPLVLKDFGGQNLPGLASSWEMSEDGLTYTFHLLEGVKFHDGTDMTAEDVVASLQRMKAVSGTSWETEDMESFEAVDEYTVQVNMSRPFTGLVDRLATAPSGWGIMPKEIAEEVGDAELTGDQVIGTGPYILADFVPQQSWNLERFEDYHGQFEGEPSHKAGVRNSYLDTIRITRVAEPATRLSGLLAGDYDLVAGLSSDDLPVLENQPGFVTNIVPGALGWYLKFNSIEGPFANETLRDAVRVSIDPEEIMAGFGDPRTWELNVYPRFHPTSPYHLDINEEYYYPSDVELGRALVEQSGYDGEPIRILASRDLAGWFIPAIGIAPMMEEIGLNVELITVDRAAQLDIANDTGNWEMKTSYSTPIRRFGVMGFHGRHRPGPRWGWSDAEHQYYEEVLFRDASRTQEALERLAEIELERSGQIWLGHSAMLHGAREGVEGLPYSHYLTLWNVWLDE
ncbi:MAG: ABC transporter substrate-binding protein [Trueperaceae bacterium]